MKFRWWVAAVLILLSAQARAEDSSALLVKAQEAYNKQNLLQVQAYLNQMQAKQDILAPYADYWRMLLMLSSADHPSVQQFMDQYAAYPFADRVRGEWLKQLGKRQDWQTFFNTLPDFQRDDAAVSCLTLQGQHALGHVVDSERVERVWMVGTEQPNQCGGLYDAMFRNGTLTEEHAWQRFRLAMQGGKITVAKSISQYIPAIDTNNIKLIDRVYQNPQQVLQKQSISYKSRFGRELNMYAVDRVARTQPPLALDVWQKHIGNFNAEERSYMWGRLALYAARRHDPAANEWFKLAKELDNEQMAWRVRAALRIQDWDGVLTAIDAMPESEQQVAAWRYWKARAYKAKQELAAANAILAPLSKEYHYYGLLAEEELGDVMSAPTEAYKASYEEIKAVAAQPGIKRALALNNLGFRWEARAEWAMATKGYDDKQLIAAAEVAFRNDWIDVAINTADKTQLIHDFALRYPTPYREKMQAYVKENALDEAWVYGLIRQESRFIGVAKSSAGASGLMQVMPATAKWIAKRLGMTSFKPGMITEIDTNIQFGTHYLRYTLDRMDGQSLMATAAYNAGPGRPKRWAADQPLEGPIYADTIPFTETRDYVKKVMANAYYYAQQMGHRNIALKERLGIVPGNAISVTVENETEADH